MKNYELIAQASIAEGLYTKEQVEEIFSRGGILPLYTYNELKRMGMQVKKGEKAVLQCRIWNFKEGKNNADITETVDNEDNSYYMHKASFFKMEQAYKLEGAENA